MLTYFWNRKPKSTYFTVHLNIQVEWVVSRDGDSYFLFSGGLPEDITGSQPSITVMQVIQICPTHCSTKIDFTIEKQ